MSGDSAPLEPNLLTLHYGSSLGILVALRLWRSRLPNCVSVEVRSDSLGVLAALHKHTSLSSGIITVVAETALDEACLPFGLSGLTRIPGLSNVQANALS
eukprot:1847503-Heterocapsa_arctica.AAC.1